jgi:hypothetical protein
MSSLLLLLLLLIFYFIYCCVLATVVVITMTFNHCYVMLCVYVFVCGHWWLRYSPTIL